MGAMAGKMDKPKMYTLSLILFRRQSHLKMAQSRINIHRGKKLNGIAKKKDDIAKHLEGGNEINAKIWVRLLSD